MRTRYRIGLTPIALIALALSAYFEPTYCVRGWLWGEAFYDGRPTSYWAAEIEQWKSNGSGGSACYWTETYSRRRWPRWSEQFLPKPSWPELFDGDPDGLAVLVELSGHPSEAVRDWARIGIARMDSWRNGSLWDKGPFKHGGLPDE